MISIDNECLLIACLKCVPQSIPDIIKVFSTIQLRYVAVLLLFYKHFKHNSNFCLSMLIVELIDNLSSARLMGEKLTIMSDIVHSQLFVNADCRAILIPYIVTKIMELLQFPEEVCVL